MVRLFPNARFVVLVRDPLTSSESVVRMWRSLAGLYAFTPPPSDDRLREIVLADRLRFKDKLVSGLAGIAPGRYTLLRYEELVRDPESALKTLYDALGLDGLTGAMPVFRERAAAVAAYRAAAVAPPGAWRERVTEVWRPISLRYGYG